MKKILVATDLSARSDRAILRATKLAKEFNSKLIILHTIDSEIPRGLIDEAEKSARQEIDRCLKEANQSLDIEIKICMGNAHAEIIKVASHEDVGLIVIGLHRHTNDTSSMIGNVIERLISSSHKPLLIVKDRFENDYTKVLSAVDAEIYSKNSLKAAFKLFKNAQFHLLSTYHIPFLGFVGEGQNIENQIADNTEQDLDDIINFLLKDLNSDNKENTPITIQKIIKKGSILDNLKEESQYLKPDLLVLGSNKGRTKFSRSIIPSTTDFILTNPPCDVFIAS